jgi:hypothetical protein
MAGIRPGTLRGEDHWSRYDHDHSGDPLDATSILTGVPGTIAPDDTAALGSALSLARSDHRHAITAAVPVAVGTALAEGAAATFARSDHVHELGSGSIDTLAQIADALITPAKLSIHYARLRRSSAQAVGSGTVSDIAWNVEEADTGGFFDSGVSTTRLTCASPGIVMVFGNVKWEANTTERRILRITHTDVSAALTYNVAGDSTDGISAESTRQSCHTGPIAVEAGDYFVLTGLQVSGATINVEGDSVGERATNFSIIWAGV